MEMIDLEIYKLDRIEEGIAILETPEKTMLSVPRNSLPEGASDGDCFVIDGENFVFSEEETKKRKNAIFDLLSGLISKN